ncbi:MAG: YggS family pyridoxal phosphate-dependent enzyme [Chloroflexi bacterium]|nr:YggS family pyridoxal phosphate-dependent enzyme [Chloroflexota bacterium]
MTKLEHNLVNLQQRIADAATRAGRNPNEITLVAVSKTFPAEAVLAAYALGMRNFGENRAEEAAEKIPLINQQLQTTALTHHRTIELPTWHLIGHLQSRKVKDAVALFDSIQSIDSVALAKKLNDRAAALGKKLSILLEVNVSGEASKYGFAPDPRETFVAAVRDIVGLSNLDLQGLMTVAPIVQNPDDARPHFRALRELRDQLRIEFPDHPLPHLSMGMTDDFQAAIAEGATIIRVGRAIFGERTSPGEG